MITLLKVPDLEDTDTCKHGSPSCRACLREENEKLRKGLREVTDLVHATYSSPSGWCDFPDCALRWTRYSPLGFYCDEHGHEDDCECSMAPLVRWADASAGHTVRVTDLLTHIRSMANRAGLTWTWCSECHRRASRAHINGFGVSEPRCEDHAVFDDRDLPQGPMVRWLEDGPVSPPASGVRKVACEDSAPAVAG